MKPLAVSVPHSGTRTLCQMHGLTKQHFGSGEWVDDGVAEAYAGRDDLIHIPIRNPMDVAKSWALRFGTTIEDLLDASAQMFEYLRWNAPHLYRMEDYPRLAGTDDQAKQRNPGDPRRIEPFEQAVREAVVIPHRAFFE